MTEVAATRAVLTDGEHMRLAARRLLTLGVLGGLLTTATPAGAIDNTNNCWTIQYELPGKGVDLRVTACVAFSNSGVNVQYKASAVQVQHPGTPFIADQFSMFTVLAQLRYNGSNLRTSVTCNNPTDASRAWTVACEGAWPRGTVVTWTAWGAVRYTDSTGTHYGDVDGWVAISSGITG